MYSHPQTAPEAQENVPPESKSTKTWILRSALTGLAAGTVSFMPVLMICLAAASYIGFEDIFNSYNTNPDDFLLGYFCLIPSTPISLLGGIIGGGIGHRNHRKYLGAILGGLLGPISTLGYLTIYILNSWAAY